MKPIRYDRRQVALWVKVASFFNPDLPVKVGETSFVVDFVIDEAIPPTPPILNYFNLTAEGDHYVWQPR